MNNSKRNVLLLLFLCLFLYLFGSWALSLTDPDEVFYAETAKEMLVHKSFLTPLIFQKPQFEKPPFFYWLLSLSFSMFRISGFSARLVSVLAGVFGVVGTYWFANRIFNDEKVALNSSLILATSLLYLIQSKIVLTDICFSVSITLSLYSFYLWFKFSEKKFLYSFGIFSAVSTLTKTPLGIIIPLAVIISFLAFTGNQDKIKQFFRNKWWVLFLVISLPWYVYVSAKYGNQFYREFFVHDHWDRLIFAEHGSSDKWYFYPCVIILGMFPWTFYFFNLNRKMFREHRNESMFLLLWIGGFLYAFFPVHSKLASYILPVFPAVAILLGISLKAEYDRGWKRSVIGVLYLITALVSIASIKFIKNIYTGPYYHLISGIVLFCVVQLTCSFFYFRKKVNLAVLTQVFLWVAIYIIISPLAISLQGAFSNGDISGIISKYKYYENPIVCDNHNVRGVYFFTGYPVTVIASDKNPFWSGHPIPTISTDEEIKSFFDGYDTLLCVINKNELDRINNMFKTERNNTIVYQNKDRFVVISRKIRKSFSRCIPVDL